MRSATPNPYVSLSATAEATQEVIVSGIIESITATPVSLSNYYD